VHALVRRRAGAKMGQAVGYGVAALPRLPAQFLKSSSLRHGLEQVHCPGAVWAAPRAAAARRGLLPVWSLLRETRSTRRAHVLAFRGRQPRFAPTELGPGPAGGREAIPEEDASRPRRQTTGKLTTTSKRTARGSSASTGRRRRRLGRSHRHASLEQRGGAGGDAGRLIRWSRNFSRESTRRRSTRLHTATSACFTASIAVAPSRRRPPAPPTRRDGAARAERVGSAAFHSRSRPCS
jgi:hypothetical protein